MNFLLAALADYFRPKNIINIPAGQQGVDATGANGLIGFMANANAYSQQMASYASSGTAAVVIAPSDVVDGVIQVNSGASGGYAITLPTTAQMLAALGPSVPQDGSFTKIVRIVNNNSGQTGTLTAGDTPTSITGTATIATNTARDFAMRVLASSINFTNIGSLTL